MVDRSTEKTPSGGCHMLFSIMTIECGHDGDHSCLSTFVLSVCPVSNAGEGGSDHQRRDFFECLPAIPRQRVVQVSSHRSICRSQRYTGALLHVRG